MTQWALLKTAILSKNAVDTLRHIFGNIELLFIPTFGHTDNYVDQSKLFDGPNHAANIKA